MVDGKYIIFRHFNCFILMLTPLDKTISTSSGTDVCTGEEVGIKIERVDSTHPLLHNESKVYKLLQGNGMYSTQLSIGARDLFLRGRGGKILIYIHDSPFICGLMVPMFTLPFFRYRNAFIIKTRINPMRDAPLYNNIFKF